MYTKFKKYHINMKSGRCLLHLLLCLTILSAALPIMPIDTAIASSYGDLTAEEPVLLVSGDALIENNEYTSANVSNEKSYTMQEIQALTDISGKYLYSTINSKESRRIYRSEGVQVAGLLALSGYSNIGVIKTIASDGYQVSLNLSDDRYYFPNIGLGTFASMNESNAADNVPVFAILAWKTANNSKGPNDDADILAAPEADKMIDQEPLQLQAGQLEVKDVNNGLYNSKVNKLFAGEALTVKPITVLGTSYARGDILLKPRAERDYTYATKDGERTDKARGVPLAVLLADLSDETAIEFKTADNYAGITAYNMTKGELTAKNAIIAYELYDNKTQKWQGYCDGSGTEQGFFRLFMDSMSPAKMISDIATVAVTPPQPNPDEPVVLDPPFTIRQGGKPDIEWGIGKKYSNNIKDSAVLTERASYIIDGQTIEVYGAYLGDILTASGISGDNLLLTVITTDGSSHTSYQDIKIKEITDRKYFLACDTWDGPGAETRTGINDIDVNNIQASLRIYRNNVTPGEIKHISGLNISTINTGGPPTTPGATQIGSGSPTTAALIIDGKVDLPGYFTIADLQTMSGLTTRTATYTRLNRFGTRGQDTMTGVYLEQLLKTVMKLPAEAESITIIADDYSAQYNLNTITPLGVYSTDMSGNKIMLAWSGTAPIAAGTLRLIVGQSDPDYVNTPNWISNVKRITVSEYTVKNPGGSGSWNPGNTTDTTDKPGEDSREEISIPVKADVKVSDKTASVTLSPDTITKAVDKYVTDTSKDKINARIVVDATSDKQTNKTVFTFAQQTIELLAEYERTSAEIKTDQGSIIFSSELLGFLEHKGEGDLIATIESKDTEAAKDIAAVNIAIDRGGVTISEFGGILLKLDIPLIPDKAVSDEGIVVYHTAENGERSLIKLASYTSGSHSIKIGLTHLSTYVIGSNPKTFTDIQDHWAKRDIEFLASREIVNGRTKDTFIPQGTVTRAEFVKMLAGSVDGIVVPTTGSTGFSDVSDNAWYTGYIKWAAGQGIAQGYPKGTFLPNDLISREEMAVMLDRYIKSTKFKLSAVQKVSEFTDKLQISAFAESAISTVQQYGLISGNPDGSLSPKSPITRAEASKVIRAYIEAVLR